MSLAQNNDEAFGQIQNRRCEQTLSPFIFSFIENPQAEAFRSDRQLTGPIRGE